MLTINTSECSEMSTISKFQNPSYYYVFKINNEIQIQELLKELVNIIQQTNSQNYQLLIQTLYYILRRSNMIVKYNYKPNKVYLSSDIKRSDLADFNYLFILNKQILFKLNYNTFEELLKNNNKLQFITYYLNLNQYIPDQAIYTSNNKYELLLVRSKLNRNEETKKICYDPIIQNDNLSKSNNPFKLLNNKSISNINQRTLSIKNNRKIKETKILRKKESIHNITNNDSFITKKKEGNKGKALKYLKKKNLSIKGLNIKRGTIHGNLKKMNDELISKYYFYQEGLGHFKVLVNHSCLFTDNQMNLDGLSDKEKVKMFFKGKYFKNLYQKINVFQNNLRDYVNSENHEIKQDKNISSNKILTIGLKNSKSFNNLQMDYPSLKKINTLNLSLSQSNLSEKNTIRNITLKSNNTTKATTKNNDNNDNNNNNNENNINYLNSKSSSRTGNTNNLSDTNLLNTKYLSLDNIVSTTQITAVNVENLPNSKYSTEFNQSIKSLKDSTENRISKENPKEKTKENPKENQHNTVNTPTNKQTRNIDKEVFDFNNNNNDLKSKFNQEFSSQNNLIEKTNIISSNEIVSPSVTSNSNSEINNISTEQVNLTSSANSSKRNRRSKHNRSSAVCLSSNDIKGILEQTRKNEVPSNSNSMSSYTMERSLNDSTKYQRGYIASSSTISKDSMERRKLLSRDYYHPTLSTLSSTPFCYSDYYPTIRLPLMPRSSSFYSTKQQTHQPWINPSKLNV
ncbi:hypothetical protein U3516DRAFT_911700 [Neocallimastix sp. 'constans']